MQRDDLVVESGLYAQLVGRQVEERRQLATIRQLVVGLAELVEEVVSARFERRDAGRGRVLEQLAHQVDGLGRRAWTKDFVPRVSSDLREFEFLIVGIHLSDLFARGRAEHFDDLD